jgi:hypothetical protein
MSEPVKFFSGDALSWSRTLDSVVDTASYRLVGAESHYTIAATVDGLTLSASADSTTTAGYTPGSYKWFLLATVGTDRLTLDEGYLVIEDNPANLTDLNTQTHAEKVLAAIESRIEGRILSDHENYSIDGRSLTRIPIDQLIQIRRQYQWIVHDLHVKRGQKKTLTRVIHR